jgi:hypothetical protein
MALHYGPSIPAFARDAKFGNDVVSFARGMGSHCFSHLLHDPECIRSRYVKAENLAPIMPDDEKAVKDATRKRRHSEEVHSRNSVPLIPQEHKPALARICSLRARRSHRETVGSEMPNPNLRSSP